MTNKTVIVTFVRIIFLLLNKRKRKSKGQCKKWTITGTCFIQKIYAPSSSLLRDKHLPFSPSPLRFNIFRLFVILSLTQLYRYTPEIFLFSTFKYTYRAPTDNILHFCHKRDRTKTIKAKHTKLNTKTTNNTDCRFLKNNQRDPWWV